MTRAERMHAHIEGDRVMEYGTAAYHIEKAHRHLDNFEGQLRAIPDDANPDDLRTIWLRVGQIHDQAQHAIDYAKTCRDRKIEAEARVDAVIADTRRAA